MILKNTFIMKNFTLLLYTIGIFAVLWSGNTYAQLVDFTENHSISCNQTLDVGPLGYPTWIAPSIIQNPQHGTAIFVGDLWMFPHMQYTPNAGFEGTDTIVVECAHATQITCATGTYIVEVSCTGNYPPTAQSDTLCIIAWQGLTNQPLQIADANNDPLTIVVVDEPDYGTLSINADNTFNYTANTCCTYDSFSYNVCDPSGACANATVWINLAEMFLEDLLPDTTKYYYTIAPDSILQLCGNLGYALQHNGEPNLYTVTLYHNSDAATLTYLNEDCIKYQPLQNGTTDIITVVGCGDAPPPSFYTCEGYVEMQNCSYTSYIITIQPDPGTETTIEPYTINCTDTLYIFGLGDPFGPIPIIEQIPANGTADIIIGNVTNLLAYYPDANFNGIDTVVVQCARLVDGVCQTVAFAITVDCLNGLTLNNAPMPTVTTYPNPITGTVTVSGQSASLQQPIVQLSSIAGQVLQTFNPALDNQHRFTQTIDLSNLPTGMYMVIIQDYEVYRCMKVIKN